MRLPTLSVIIVSQLIVWCIVGATYHGPMILVYPASWLVIGAGFYLHAKKFPISPAGSISNPDQTWANSSTASKNGADSGQPDSTNPPQVATAE